MPLVIIGWTRAPNKNDGISLHGPLEHHIDGTGDFGLGRRRSRPPSSMLAKGRGRAEHTHANREPMAGGARGTMSAAAGMPRKHACGTGGAAKPARTVLTQTVPNPPKKVRLLRPMKSQSGAAPVRARRRSGRVRRDRTDKRRLLSAALIHDDADGLWDEATAAMTA